MTMTRRYKAVFFDLDGTLRIVTPSPIDAFLQFARSLGAPIEVSRVHGVKLWSHRYWGNHEQVGRDMVRFTEDEFWTNYSRLLLTKAGVTKKLEQRALRVRDWFYEAYAPDVQLVPGGHETLAALKEAGYRLALISNRSNPLEEAVMELELDGIFDLILAAGEVGYWKPNPAIFNYVLQQFTDLQPEHCLYIGDNFYADGQGATAAGLTPILYDPENLYHDHDYRRIDHMEQLISLLVPA